MGEEVEMLDVTGRLVRVNVVVALLAVGETLTSDHLRVPCGSQDANYPNWVEARIIGPEGA
jgi:hypothetical protein